MTDESNSSQAVAEETTAVSGTDQRDAGRDRSGGDAATGSDGRADDGRADDGRSDDGRADDGRGGEASTSEPIGLAAAKDAAVDAAEELIDHPIDSVIRIERDGDDWRTLVEVVERSAIPDTQDILGRYEIVVDDAGTLVQYGLEERYRRGENRDEL